MIEYANTFINGTDTFAEPKIKVLGIGRRRQ